MQNQNDLVAQLIGKRIVFVVAHQDDESLWFGGLLSQLAGKAELHLISVTAPMPGRPDTETRLEAFRRVGEMVGAIVHCLALPDCLADATHPRKPLSTYRDAINAELDRYAPQKVVTHDIFGEPCSVYPSGHAMHKIVALVAHGMWPTIHRKRGGTMVPYDLKAKRALLDCYAPQWSPDNYPWADLEFYA